MHKRHISRGGFALPTVLIASVVMLTVLATAVSSVAAVRTTLKAQYYEQLAKAAGEAGVAYAKACLAKNGNRPLWTNDKPLKPSTDCAGNELLTPAVQVMVAAGGGGGGNNHGGGGGGGGVVTEDAFTVSAGQSYTVVVGGGGVGGTTGGNAGTKGSDSSFGGIVVAEGGGGGGGRVNTNSVTQAGAGGAGGGGAGTIDGATGQPGAGGAGTPGQGYDGGRGSSGATAGNGGGGGGAGEVGGAASGTASGAGISGKGGSGLASSITGATIYYGGGGSGGRWVDGAYGLPGVTGGGRGGTGDSIAGLPGIANTGGGGGGGGGAAAAGGNGGSGVVIVRYGNTGSIVASGGSESVSGAYKIHRFAGNGSLTVSSANNASCPEDPRCSVTSNNALRSSFRVGSPTLDSQGRALTIPNNGYVELLRSSTGAVWRTYRQPAVQAAAVPDLCSGAAASGLGWQNAIASSSPLSIPGSTSAQAITLVDVALPAGKIYFRKDFTVNAAGTYTLTATTPSARDVAAIYLDGAPVGSSQGSLLNTPVNLSAGCHVMTVELTNVTLELKATRFAAAIQQGGSAPLVETDTSWRASSGEGVHFSQSDFYADPAIWSTVVPYNYQTAQASNAAWQSTQSDVFTGFMSPPGNSCPTTCPTSSSGYMRDSKDFILTESRDVQVSTLCDDDCSVFLDGEMIIANSPWSAINQQSLTLTKGPHRVAIRVYNGAGNAGGAVSVVDKVSGEVYSRTDRTWQGATEWTSGLNASTENIRAYEDSFRPSPDEIPRNDASLDVLMVGGGGGGGSNSGGGGGGGGVLNLSNLSLETGTYNVTIGAGGVGGLNSGTAVTSRGQNGGNTIFGSFTAVGGGGGASRDWGPEPSVGGSGGGGSGSGVNAPTSRYLGASGTLGQGHSGGNGTPSDQGGAAKGGGGGGATGAGVAANTTTAGNGGSGYITYITGARQSFAGGGGGGNTASNGYLGAATDGGIGGVGTAAPANRGGGGSGIAGVGGSGVVIVRVKQTPTLDFDFTGAVNFSVASINGHGYSIMTFTGAGTFSIYSY